MAAPVQTEGVCYPRASDRRIVEASCTTSYMTQGPQASNDLIVVLNWFDQLRGQRSTAGNRGPAGQ